MPIGLRLKKETKKKNATKKKPTKDDKSRAQKIREFEDKVSQEQRIRELEGEVKRLKDKAAKKIADAERRGAERATDSMRSSCSHNYCVYEPWGQTGHSCVTNYRCTICGDEYSQTDWGD